MQPAELTAHQNAPIWAGKAFFIIHVDHLSKDYEITISVIITRIYNIHELLVCITIKH